MTPATIEQRLAEMQATLLAEIQRGIEAVQQALATSTSSLTAEVEGSERRMEVEWKQAVEDVRIAGKIAAVASFALLDALVDKGLIDEAEVLAQIRRDTAMHAEVYELMRQYRLKYKARDVPPDDRTEG